MGDGLCLDVKSVCLIKDETLESKMKMLEENDLFLIEDYKVESKDVLEVKGDPINKTPKFQYKMMPVRFQYEKQDIYTICQVSSECIVEHIYDMIVGTDLFLPKTVTLWFDGKEMKDHKAKLSSLGIVANSIIQIKGKYLLNTIFFKFNFAKKYGNTIIK